VATAGDRRDEDMRQLGRVAARYFNVVIVREDRNPRGRERGETAAIVAEGVREAMRDGPARAGTVEIVLDEMEAARRALDRARPGDVVVLCVDYATEIYKELEQRRGSATPAALRPSEQGLIEAVGGDVDLIDLTSTPR
jgi:cyanophycin synthetase